MSTGHTIRPRRGAAPSVSRPPRRVERSGIGCSTAPHLVDGTNVVARSGWVSARAGVSARGRHGLGWGHGLGWHRFRQLFLSLALRTHLHRYPFTVDSAMAGPRPLGADPVRFWRADARRVVAGARFRSPIATRPRPTAPLGPGSVVQSTRLTVRLEGARLGRDQRPVAFATDGEADDVLAAVVVLDEGPDDDRRAAFRGLHLGPVQGRCDLEDLHGHHGKPGSRGL